MKSPWVQVDPASNGSIIRREKSKKHRCGEEGWGGKGMGRRRPCEDRQRQE